MKTLGLTGSIGMGKSTTAGMFRDAGIPVYDADAAVHAIYAKGGSAVGPLSERFDGIVIDGAIDRAALRDIVVNDAVAMSDLEAIVHPLVGLTQLEFRKEALASNAPFAVLDIPLLFETGGDKRVDLIAVVTAPADVQKDRVLSRGEMDEAAFEAIRAKQTPDADKRARADFIISTAWGLDFTRAHVDAIVTLLRRKSEEPENDG